MESDRLIRLAREEMSRHQEQAQQLHDAADLLVDQAEFHLRQSDNWQKYLADITVSNTVTNVIPMQRHLSLVKGDGNNCA